MREKKVNGGRAKKWVFQEKSVNKHDGKRLRTVPSCVACLRKKRLPSLSPGTGRAYMKRYLENRADRPVSEWGTIAPGEGTGLLKFWKGINEALDGTYEYPFNASKISVP